MPHEKRYRREHDPYNDMEGAIIRPQEIARQSLSDAEKSASSTKSSPNQSKNSSRSPREKRERDNFLESPLQREEQSQKLNSFRNSVRGREAIEAQSGKNSGKKKGLLKRFGPVGAIVGLLFGGGFFFYAAQTMLGPHLTALITQNTDVQFTQYSMRNPKLFKYLMDGNGQVTISGFSKKYKTFSPYLKNRLSNNGIEVGYIDADGAFQTDQLLSTHSTVLKYNDEIIDADAFTTKFAADANFRDAYYNAKRGRISGFFDKSADKYYKSKGATRDIFDEYKSTGDPELDKVNFEDTVTERMTGSNFSANTVHHDIDEETGEEIKGKNGDDLSSKNIDGVDAESKARSFVNGIAGKVSSVGVPVCGALRIANIAAVTVSAYQIIRASAYFLSLMEPLSKAMAGEGDASAVNETLNFLTNQTTSTINYVDDSGNTVTEEDTGSALESAGAKLTLAQTRSSQKEIAPYSINNITKAATTIALSTGVTTTVCTGVMASSAIIALASNAMPGGALATFAVGSIMKFVGGIVMTAVVSKIISAIIPYIAKIFSEKIFDEYTGKQAGNLMFLGASTSNGEVAKSGSGFVPASEERLKEQNRNTVLALAGEAELDRLHRSPFDPTSPNTFLGSIMGKFALLGTNTNILSTVSGIATTIGNSVAKLTPAAGAADQELMYTSEYEECRDLPGAMCDIYGVPIMTSDYSTIDISPDDPTYLAVIMPNLKDDGETIKEDSELAKYINFCANRQSPWGVKDANILNALQTDAGTAINNMPGVENIVDVINAAEDLANEGWATGSICMNSADNPRWDNEFKYYQLYVQDMRTLSTMDDQAESHASQTAYLMTDEELYGGNPVLAYELKYEAEHPLDTSYEGTLARISGQTKEDIAFLLEVIEYADFLANYDTTDLFKFHNNNPEPSQLAINSKAEQSPSFIFPTKQNILIDRRNYLV